MVSSICVFQVLGILYAYLDQIVLIFQDYQIQPAKKLIIVYKNPQIGRILRYCLPLWMSKSKVAVGCNSMLHYLFSLMSHLGLLKFHYSQ